MCNLSSSSGFQTLGCDTLVACSIGTGVSWESCNGCNAGFSSVKREDGIKHSTKSGLNYLVQGYFLLILFNRDNSVM